MRDKQIGDAEPLLQILKQVHHLRADRDIQRGHRLIRDDHARFRRDGPCDCYALALAAGELERMPAKVHRIEPDQSQQLDDTLPSRGSRDGQAVHIERFGDDVLDDLAWTER